MRVTKLQSPKTDAPFSYLPASLKTVSAGTGPGNREGTLWITVRLGTHCGPMDMSLELTREEVRRLEAAITLLPK